MNQVSPESVEAAHAQSVPAVDTSIVIATCGRVDMLRVAVASLLREAAAFPAATELVIVDDESTDATPVFLAELHLSSPIPVRILQGQRRGVAAARNLGWSAARGTWIASFDDDQIALPGWLSALRSAADAQHAACVGGSLQLSLPAGFAIADFGPRARRLLGENHPGDAPSRYAGDVLPATNNVLLRRDVFIALNGFDTSFTEGAEDTDFFDRMTVAGHSLWYEPRSQALHVMTPHRLARHDLRWTSLRIGVSRARLHRRQGTVVELKWAVVRLTITAARDLPQLLWAGLRGNRYQALDALCSLWYTQGVLRGLATTRGRDVRFLHSMDFRTRNGERQDSTRRETSAAETSSR